MSTILILAFTACNRDVSPENYEIYHEPGELVATNHYDNDYYPPDEPPIDDTPLSIESQDAHQIHTDVFWDMASGERHGEITHIVIHFISNVIANPANPYVIEDIASIFRTYGVSAHYIIDRDGTIHLAVPEDRVAFHAGAGSLADFPAYENNLNQHSIGIELLGMGTQEEMSLYLTAYEFQSLDPSFIGFTEAQYDALNWLLNGILARHPGIQPNRTHIIGHSEYSPGKVDPGMLFEWERLDFMR